MEDLTPLYEKRDARYNKQNNKLLKLISTTLECVTAYLRKMDPAVQQGNISWEDTSLMDDMIIMIGMLSYDVGKTIDFGGIEVVVTETNVAELQQMVHMAVPINLVEEADSEKITAYLLTLSAQSNSEVETDIIRLPAAVHEHDFDLTELSDEQLENLKLSTLKTGH